MNAVLIEPGYHVELIDGREIQKPLPEKLHALIERFLIVAFMGLAPEYLGLPELNVLTGEITGQKRRGYVVPDVTVVRHDAAYLDGDLAEPPLLAVEILSPGRTISDLFVRSERLLKLGSPVVWVIWPERRKAWVHTVGDLVEQTSQFVASLPNGALVEVDLAKMWATLD